MTKMKDLIIDPIDLQSMSIKDLELLKSRLFGKALTKFPSSPRQFKVRAEIDKVWNEINRRRGLENNMSKSNEDSQRSNKALRKSSRIIRLPGDNSRDAEAPKPWSKAESLIRLMENLPSGFSIEEFNVDTQERSVEFIVSFPVSAAKGFTPPEGNRVYVSGLLTLDVYYDKPYRGSIEGLPGGGWDIGISYENISFVDDDNRNIKVPDQAKAIVNFLEKNFEDEFLSRIEDEFEEKRTEYRGD